MPNQGALKTGPLRCRRRQRAPANMSPLTGCAPGLEINVGHGLRKLRSERNLSIRALAEKPD
jgi:hypothetical protein